MIGYFSYSAPFTVLVPSRRCYKRKLALSMLVCTAGCLYVPRSTQSLSRGIKENYLLSLESESIDIPAV